MGNLPGNSQRAPKPPEQPKEKIQQVTSGATVRRKRNLGKKFKETFIQGDARTAVSSVFFDILIPSMKDMMFDAFESGVRSLIYGEDAKRRTTSASSGYAGLGHVAYNSMTKAAPARPTEQRVLSRRARAQHDFGEIIIASREEAETVLDRMFDIVSRFGSVSVADLCELTGIQSAMTDMKWGWTALEGAKAIRTRQGGFLLDLPVPEQLSR